jgi:hypothetical protein
MKRILATLFVLHFAATPLAAQDDDGPSLMERGAQQFLEGLLQEMEPAFQGMREFMEQMGPAMAELLAEIKDWSVYEPPEVLDNGDIIIRRKPDAPKTPQTQPAAPSETPPQIDL